MYMISEVMGFKPQLEKGVFVAHSAQIIGDVRLLEGANVWYNAVLRGDVASITVGRGSNIQDNCTLHCDLGVPLVIGDNVTVGHNAVLHCCTIGDGTLIGMGAVVLSGATIGSGCIIAAGAVVTPRTVVPDGSLFMGNPAKLKRMLSSSERQDILNNAVEYKKLVSEYKAQETAEISKNCVLSKGLSQSHLYAIKNLADLCENYEPVHLKLDWSMLEHRDANEVNDILYYENGNLAGYLGIYQFSKNSKEVEVTGMVRPDLRRRGIFGAMFNIAKRECQSRGVSEILLVTDRFAGAGSDFARQNRFVFENREAGMNCKQTDWKQTGSINLTFRKATESDIKELAFLDMMGFELKREEAEGFYSDGLRGEVFIAQEDGKPIGKIAITDEQEKARIHGLVVGPFFRGRGYGREILEFALDRIFEASNSEVMLEVDEDNKIAFSLYTSSGFKKTAEYDYYKMKL